MPSKSPEQARLMRAVAHGWKKPGGGGPTKAVAREFVEADKRRGNVTGYQYGGRAMPMGRSKPMMGGALSRDPRAMPPATTQPVHHTTGGPGRPIMRPQPTSMRMPMKPMPPPRRGMPPRGMPPRGGMPGMPPRGGIRQMTDFFGGRGPGGAGGMPPKFQGRRMAPPPNKFPGGGHPNLGGRNPMMRMSQRYQPGMRGRGPTSFLR